MKKLLFVFASTILASSVLAAEAPEIRIKGALDFQAAARNQKNLDSDNMLTNNQKKNAFNSRAEISVNISNETECGMKYGAEIDVKTTTDSKAMNGSYIFTEADFGRLEAGNRIGAQNAMAQSAYSIAAATGDDWFYKYANLNPAIYGGKAAYNGDFSGYSDVYSGVYGERIEQPRKLTYYTPEYYGMQLGVSYAPDASNIGSGSIKPTIEKETLYDKAGATIAVAKSVKNLMGAGWTFKHNLSDGVDFVLGAGYEQGQASVKDDAGNKVKFSDHKLYNVGAVMTYGVWSVAASYADAGKSMTSDVYTLGKRKNKMYTAGVAYKQGPMGLSLVYLNNQKFNNKLESYTLGTDYAMAPGILPYAEVTSFKVKNKGFDVSGAVPTAVNKKLDGMVYIIGTKISF